jgi:hypothetical protein
MRFYLLLLPAAVGPAESHPRRPPPVLARSLTARAARSRSFCSCARSLAFSFVVSLDRTIGVGEGGGW